MTKKKAGKCDYKQQYKGIFEAEMISTPEVLKDNSPI